MWLSFKKHNKIYIRHKDIQDNNSWKSDVLCESDLNTNAHKKLSQHCRFLSSYPSRNKRKKYVLCRYSKARFLKKMNG